jgi:D-sedoheptulose 7-phosphate isomerase
MTVHSAFDAHRRAVDESEVLLAPLVEQAASLIEAALRAGGKVLACGNGGSAADAQHFTAELVGRHRSTRRALAAVALGTDTSALTAIGNDSGFERVFARQLEALGDPGDVLLAISTSGSSPNVVAAAREARARSLQVVALTGRGGGRLSEWSDLLLAVPSVDTPRIQEVHGLCLHIIAELVESRFGGVA